MDESRLRIRAILERWFTVLLVALILLAGVGAWATYSAHIAPGTHEEERVVDQWRVEGSFSHQATVTEAAQGTVFEPGSVVKNRTVYFQRVMPVLDGEFALSHTGSNPLDVRIQRHLVVQSAEPTRGDEQSVVYWQERRSLGTTKATVQPNQQTAIPFEVNVSQTIQDAYNVSERLDSPGQIETQLEVSVLATPQGTGDEQQLTFSLPIVAQSSIYQVEGEPQGQTFSETETVRVPNEPEPLYSIGGPFALLLGVVGCLGLWTTYSRGMLALSETDREWLAYKDDRTDFDEWITTIDPPTEVTTSPTAEAATLADLVNFAIDTDNAVLTPSNESVYYVIHDETKYQYQPPANPSGASERYEPAPVDTDS